MSSKRTKKITRDGKYVACFGDVKKIIYAESEEAARWELLEMLDLPLSELAEIIVIEYVAPR